MWRSFLSPSFERGHHTLAAHPTAILYRVSPLVDLCCGASPLRAMIHRMAAAWTLIAASPNFQATSADSIGEQLGWNKAVR
jgi:hypothetical protein